MEREDSTPYSHSGTHALSLEWLHLPLGLQSLVLYSLHVTLSFGGKGSKVV